MIENPQMAELHSFDTKIQNVDTLYCFEDRYDLVKLIELIKQAGLYAHLIIGPYAWFSVWLKYLPGISFKTDNGPFEYATEKFTRHLIENEYGPLEYELGAPAGAYTKWAAQVAVGLGTGVPWVMCNQDDAPDPIVSLMINTCNKSWIGWFTDSEVVKTGDTFSIGQYSFTGSETTSVWLEIEKVEGVDVVCKIKNPATLAGALFALHGSQIHVDLPTLTDKDKEVLGF
ncbi:hypothetical protein L2E82_13623 [Cichorium intybus]|uniref:Uncharacterized protein n=1 Tax=Cichorium intybus TaxID=13427 RepID=A0ACB9EYD0_CICIN|nr:hypothetical protein L2E82_13623 [Cichorium intybus]